uniref:4F5 domain-containing protein n=1 Tax=Angiostrongylus cantonensis TaxID=6313 RepID=A0A0K0D8S8_ANGCA
MARGHQKIQAQQRAHKRAEAAKKSQSCDQKGAALKALHHKCIICMVFSFFNLRSSSLIFFVSVS